MITSQCTGQVLEAKTASFKDDNGNTQSYGKIQLLTKDMSGEFFAIQNIKVKTENFGLIPDVRDLKGKNAILNLSTNEYKGKISYYFESLAK